MVVLYQTGVLSIIANYIYNVNEFRKKSSAGKNRCIISGFSNDTAILNLKYVILGTFLFYKNVLLSFIVSFCPHIACNVFFDISSAFETSPHSDVCTTFTYSSIIS